MDVRVKVVRGHLIVEDGLGETRRVRRIPRMPREVARLFILCDSGYVSLDAVSWCADLGITITQLDRYGRILLSSPSQQGSARIRQAQAVASAGGLQAIRLESVRRLLVAKLEGQERNALELLRREDVADAIREQIRGLGKASTLKELTGYEGNAAMAYWNAWAGRIHVPFSPKATLILPIHWNTYRGRPSGTRTVGAKRRNRSLDNPEPANRGATDPINAMLNYAYKIAETEAMHLCHAHSLDPGIGLMHMVESDRQAMALDLMEVARPVADRAVLSLLDTGHGVSFGPDGKPAYLQALWFRETSQGVCRLVAPLTHMLAESCLDMATAIEPHIRDLALALSNARIPDLSAMQAGKPSIVDVRTRNARIAIASPLARMPVPNDAREVITDEQWDKIRIHVPIVKNLMGAKRLDDRLVLAAIVYATANGISLTALPDSLRLHYRTAERRIQEWKSCGAWPRITRAIRASVLPGFSG